MTGFGGAAGGALVTAFAITLLELTEVIAIVYAMGAASRSLRPGLLGAIGGVAMVGLLGLGAGVALTRVPQVITLAVGAVILWAFGVFLLRSTLRTYLTADRQRWGVKTGGRHAVDEGLSPRQLTSLGFSVGSVEALEAVVVLIAISAGGFPWEAVAGAAAAGVALVALGLTLHQNIRKLKVPPLKWATTSLLMTYATFWSWEALGGAGVVATPPALGPLPNDVLLIPIFFVVLLTLRGVIELRLSSDRRTTANPPAGSKGNTH